MNFSIDNPNGPFLATDLDRTYGPSTASPLGDLLRSGSGVRGPGPWSGMGMDQMKSPIRKIMSAKNCKNKKLGVVGDFS